MAKKKRNKIKYCFEDYRSRITESERREYEEKFKPLVEIILDANDDDEVLARVREHDTANGTDFISEAINYKIYCIVCHRVDCVC